ATPGVLQVTVVISGIRLRFNALRQRKPLLLPAYDITVRYGLGDIKTLGWIATAIDRSPHDPGEIVIHVLMVEMQLLLAALCKSCVGAAHDSLAQSLSERQIILKSNYRACAGIHSFSQPRCAPCQHYHKTQQPQLRTFCPLLLASEASLCYPACRYRF